MSVQKSDVFKRRLHPSNTLDMRDHKRQLKLKRVLTVYILGVILPKKHQLQSLFLCRAAGLNISRWNPPEVRVKTGPKPSSKIIYIVLQNSLRLFKICSQKKSFLATPNVENECLTSYETLESTGEMKPI